MSQKPEKKPITKKTILIIRILKSLGLGKQVIKEKKNNLDTV
jgi:hypothetical protein